MMMKVGVDMAPTMYDHTPEMNIIFMKKERRGWFKGQCSLLNMIWKWPCSQSRIYFFWNLADPMLAPAAILLAWQSHSS